MTPAPSAIPAVRARVGARACWLALAVTMLLLLLTPPLGVGRIDAGGAPERGEMSVEQPAEVLYDAMPEQALAGSGTSGFVTAGTVPVPAGVDVFALSSRPASTKTIYLDFTGETLSGTAWTGIRGTATAPAWSIDGDPTSFSALERQVIYTVWLRVAEDYRAVDVTVTTAPPAEETITRDGTQDTAYGTRVLITPTTAFGALSCGCGGKSYVGSFANPTRHAYYQPALVFSRNNLNSADRLAEAAAHEAGHTLGLRHASTATSAYFAGTGDWAPIMGLSYDKAVTQFDRGEYAGATNLQDDYATMAAAGVRLIPDDVSGRISAPTETIGRGGRRVGIIAEPVDVDAFGYRHPGGPVTLTATGARAGGDLDVMLSVWTRAGRRVAMTSPPTALSATMRLTLAPGDYTITVQSARAWNYTTYGSRGEYTLSVA